MSATAWRVNFLAAGKQSRLETWGKVPREVCLPANLPCQGDFRAKLPTERPCDHLGGMEGWHVARPVGWRPEFDRGSLPAG